MSEADAVLESDPDLSSSMTAPVTPVHEDEHHRAHGRERNRRVIRSVLTALLIKPLALVTTLLVPALFVKYLGKEGYGLYEATVALAALLSITNAGLTLGLVNRLMDCFVSGDTELAKRYVSSLTLSLAAMVAVVGVGWTIASATVDWAHALHVSDPALARATPWAVWAAGIATLVGLLSNVPQAVYMAHQEIAAGNVWDGAAKVAVLAASFAIVRTPFGLVGVAVATTWTQVLVSLANTSVLYVRRPWLRPHLRYFRRDLVGSTLGEGLSMFALQLSVLALYQCDKLIITSVIDPAAVTHYALLGRIYVSAYGLFMILLLPLWPAHGEAVRRGDWRWVRRNVRLSIAVGFALIAGCGAVLLAFGGVVMRILTRGQVNEAPRTLVLAMTATFLARVWADSRSVVLNSASVVFPQVFFFLAHAALNLGVGIWAGKRYGVAGVAWATPITALLTTTWGYPWLMHRFTGTGRKEASVLPNA
jgi:O-antigen/teichoic acid export membrane protein